MTQLINNTGPASPFDAIRHTAPDGSEYWSARELMPLLGYPEWREFRPAIDRAYKSAEAQGHDPEGLFGVITEKGLGRPREDVHLARFACYLVAMNGDPRKPEVAAAQAYFAIKTREAEVAPIQQLTGPALYLAAIEQAQGEIAALEAKNRALAPKADSFDGFLGSAGDYSLNEGAKLLARNGVPNMGQNRLRDHLLRWGWLYRGRKERLRASQAAIETGRLAERTSWYYDEETGEKQAGAVQAVITPKGLDDVKTKLMHEQGFILSDANGKVLAEVRQA